MFRDDYRAAFSKVTASEDTYRRILSMTKEKKARTTVYGTLGKVLVAAATVLAMAVTASAATGGWFRQYFEKKNPSPMSQSEVRNIEENEQPIGQSQTRDGYTLTVKSAITDGWVAYVVIGVTAPEDVVLSRTTIPGYDPQGPLITQKNEPGDPFFEPASGEMPGGAYGIDTEEDYDGLDNTQDLILKAECNVDETNIPFAPGQVWRIHIAGLEAIYQNSAYLEALTEKNGGQSPHLTPEDWDKYLPRVPLTEGVWDFEIKFENNNFRTVELIQEPVAATAENRVFSPITGESGIEYQTVTINSFLLSPLTACITSDAAFTPDFANEQEGAYICAVMKDGRKIQLEENMAQPGQQVFAVRRPIVLEEVDHILLPDGTQIPMPKA